MELGTVPLLKRRGTTSQIVVVYSLRLWYVVYVVVTLIEANLLGLGKNRYLPSCHSDH